MAPIRRASKPEAGASRDGTQLRLLPGGAGRPEWRLDDRTRRVGRQGVAQAREILNRARPPQRTSKAS